MMEKQEKAGAGAVLVGVACVPLAILLNGWTFKCMWFWFVVPVFKVQGLTFLQSVGLAMATITVMPRPLPSKEKDWRTTLQDFWRSWQRQLIMLLSGWIVYHGFVK